MGYFLDDLYLLPTNLKLIIVVFERKREKYLQQTLFGMVETDFSCRRRRPMTIQLVAWVYIEKTTHG